MADKELAVSVCKDVLSRLDGISFRQTNYFFLKAGKKHKEAVKSCSSAMECCQTCLLGSFFLSLGKIKDDFQKHIVEDCLDGYLQRGMIYEKLSEAFHVVDLCQMESLFEGMSLNETHVPYSDFEKILRIRSEKFGLRSGNLKNEEKAHEIVRYICENVIRNNGEFVLE